jgi:hypothetical protein
MSAPERNAGGPRGGRTFSWHKRPGWVRCYVAYRDGKIAQEMWVPPAKPERPDHLPDAQQKVQRRGALAAERQAQLFPD